MRRTVFIAGGVGLVTLVAGVAVAASASAGTLTYEAESANNTFAGGAATTACKRCSGHTRVGQIGRSGVLTFNGVVAERVGSTKIAVTYTSPERRTAQISVNGDVPRAITFPSTRGSGRPGTTKITVTLKSGDNTVSFSNPAGWAPDLDKLVVTTDGTPPTPVPTVTASAEPGVTATVEPGGTLPPVPTSPAPSGPVDPSAPVPPSGSAAPTGTVAPTSTAAPDVPVPPTVSVPPTTTPRPTATSTSRPTPTTTRPTTAPPAPTTPPASNGNAALEAEVLAIVNRERATAGCAAVTADDRLTAAARNHSADMAARGYFSHTTPEGVDFATRITNAGYRWSGAGENVAKGQRTPTDVMTSWMNSAGHKANILNCGFKNLGVGVVADAGGSLVWTQDFASPW